MSALEEVRDLAESVARRRRLRLWDIELGGRQGSSVVRIFVDRDDGVDLETVSEVAEEISRGLDLRDPIAGRYLLEVSSPGLERSLKRPDHFAASVGKQVMVKTKNPMHEGGHRIDGVIAAAGAASVRVHAGAGEVEVPYEEIKTARTVFEW